ncbi:MAG: biotin transporter BioY, partial [Leptolyngbyaceae bacterium]|nr:biotin transporter BioY [Leptolyngbyaceae bacterium]
MTMTTRDLVYIALFAALVAALGLIPPIPLPFIPVPITAQSLGVMLAGALLGARRGALALVLFLALVAAGFPLLSGGRGGFGVFLGPSGGFLIGFPVGAYTIGWLIERWWKRLNVTLALIATAVGGIGVVYAIGIPWLAIASQTSLVKAAVGALVFIPGDAVKAVMAAIATVSVRRSYP